MTSRIAVSVPAMASAVAALLLCAGGAAPAAAQDRVVEADLGYAARGSDKAAPAPNFSPAGARVPLADVPPDAILPAGAIRPARTGVMKLGPGERTWVRVLATASAAHPGELCRLYLDRNRNDDFADDGAPLVAEPSVREKTKDVWCSFQAADLSIAYRVGGRESVERYQVNAWIVRSEEAAAADLLRHSVSSWRAGRVTIDGVEAVAALFDMTNDGVFDARDQWAVVEAAFPDAPRRGGWEAGRVTFDGVDAVAALFDMTNDGVFDARDQWAVIEAASPDALRRVLSHAEARPTGRLMFVRRPDGRESVLEFRSVTPDGRSLAFAVVDRPVTKAEDRAGDDSLRDERPRPRAAVPFDWEPTLDAALARAKATGKKVLLDFWTSWCGPCKTLDDWIWTDAEVVGALNAGYVGVRLDGDLEKALVQKYGVTGYPTIVIADAAGAVTARFGFKGSKEMIAALAAAAK